MSASTAVRESAIEYEHDVTEVRCTGRTPEAVRQEIQDVLSERQTDRWQLDVVQPIIYNSSTTGYLLLFFKRERI